MSKPRITISLKPEDHEVLQRLAELQGGSMSRIVSELLEEVMPMLEKLCVTLEKVKNSSDSVKATLLRGAQQAEDDMYPILASAQATFDSFVEVVDCGTAQAADLSTVGGAVSNDDPRPVITGVNSPKKGPKTPKLTRNQVL